MKTLLPDYVLIADAPDYSSSVVILGNCIADSENDLPTLTEFAGFVLSQGSKCTACDTGAEFIVDSLGQWSKIEKSPFSDVYTKTEIDTMLTDYYTESEVDTLVSNLQDYDENQDKYIYALVGRSDLNLLDITVLDGQTTAGNGYICQNLSINLPAGDYVWRMKRDGNTTTSMVIKAADDTELYRVTRGAGVNEIVQEFTISADAAKISIYVGYTISYSDNMIYAKR